MINVFEKHCSHHAVVFIVTIMSQSTTNLHVKIYMWVLFITCGQMHKNVFDSGHIKSRVNLTVSTWNGCSNFREIH